MKVAIVGGGIAGLAAAYDLQKAEGFEVLLYEQSDTFGGKIRTRREGDLLIEVGPDSIFTTKPWAVDLMTELGMEADLTEPLCSEFSILTKGKLHAVPRALASLIPTASGALEAAGFLSSSAKRRILKESEVEGSGREDESVASFFSRRFGRTFSNLLAEPLLAGTHAGDAKKLSMAALYPNYLGMERSHGSLSQAAVARVASAPPSRRKVGFLTLRGGMATFPQRLAGVLDRVHLSLSTQVDRLNFDNGQWTIETSSGRSSADHVILAVPARVSARLLKEVMPDAVRSLAEMRSISTAIVTLSYRLSAFRHPPTGNGFLVPSSETLPITGCTFSSNKWPGRAPQDVLLLRVFMGKDGGLDVDRQSDEELVAMASGTLAEVLKAKDPPFSSRVDRWTEAMPQYELGHLKRLACLEQAIEGLPLSLIGCSYRGNSISDCVRQGREAARGLIGRSD